MAKRQGTTESKQPSVSQEQKALENALSQIEKTFGSGAIMKLGEGSHMEIEGISTGALSLDLALGRQGFAARPHGRVIRSRVERQNDNRASCSRPSTTKRGRCGLHRCRACARSGLVQATRCGY